MTNKKLFVVAAGSGGHILPAIQCTRQWLENNPSGSVVFFTGTSELEKKIFRNYPFITHIVRLSMPQFSLRRWWLIPWVALRSVLLVGIGIAYNLRHRPEKIISTGGLLSIPLCIATRCCRRHVEIYSLDALPGKAVRALLPFAHVVHSTFWQAHKKLCFYNKDFSYKCVPAAYPLRFNESHRNVSATQVIERINTLLGQQSGVQHFDASRKTVFVLGGSQGSMLLNEVIKNFVEQNSKNQKYQIIHQTGAFQEHAWNQFYATHEIPAFTFGYDERVHEYYAVADVILCRAGAGTLFEIAFFKKPCIVIPLVASTTDHQIYNAQAMAELYPELFTIIEQGVASGDQNIVLQALQAKLSCACEI
ncbi:MAG: UDP-N-acetylglucosamine--N-acetylmuramyl-(pentapeptide) pyrophosphoryl-undecaprenol N-acetylglucosamine transferase [Candidatus Babeliales bacterium]|jgi:UDP-N-acetylglucosamine--N-acetylmuramyl-(pentapeptide) pyrophosphoryl-undecaprenol N-acetylglucosamine transferase